MTTLCKWKNVCIKGYLPYKIITSKNVSYEAKFTIFLITGKVMLISQNMQDFVFLIIP